VLALWKLPNKLPCGLCILSIPFNDACVIVENGALKHANGNGDSHVSFDRMIALLERTSAFVTRFFFNAPIAGSLEIIRFMLVLTILFGIPYAGAREQHVR
jgi:hypothetical protein